MNRDVVQGIAGRPAAPHGAASSESATCRTVLAHYRAPIGALVGQVAFDRRDLAGASARHGNELGSGRIGKRHPADAARLGLTPCLGSAT